MHEPSHRQYLGFLEKAIDRPRSVAVQLEDDDRRHLFEDGLDTVRDEVVGAVYFQFQVAQHPVDVVDEAVDVDGRPRQTAQSVLEGTVDPLHVRHHQRLEERPDFRAYLFILEQQQLKIKSKSSTQRNVLRNNIIRLVIFNYLKGNRDLSSAAVVALELLL